jgi:RNase adaptor protein for sRNA GlmZ degradation
LLKIKLYSFSYKKSGIPEDTTPNGGGFVFDCRFIYNPGREIRFMPLTGLDKPVIEFLDNIKEMQNFLSSVMEIIKPAIDNYLSRNFTDLMISFGCTGGQHRSVYAAEKFKESLESFYSKKVMIEIHHNDIPSN